MPARPTRRRRVRAAVAESYGDSRVSRLANWQGRERHQCLMRWIVRRTGGCKCADAGFDTFCHNIAWVRLGCVWQASVRTSHLQCLQLPNSIDARGCAGRAGSTFGDPEAAAQGDTSAATQFKKSAGDASEGLTRAVSDAGGQVLSKPSGFSFMLFQGQKRPCTSRWR